MNTHHSLLNVKMCIPNVKTYTKTSQAYRIDKICIYFSTYINFPSRKTNLIKLEIKMWGLARNYVLVGMRLMYKKQPSVTSRLFCMWFLHVKWRIWVELSDELKGEVAFESQCSSRGKLQSSSCNLNFNQKYLYRQN